MTDGAGAKTPRIAALDALRGLIMALMALDHARVFFLGFEPSPTDLDATSPALFATRWITHLCAPGFILLAGISARLQTGRRTTSALAGRLALRGAVLVALELTVITFGWIPDSSRSFVLLQVIWAIGWSMILLAGLILMLPAFWVGAVGVALAALHPALATLAEAAGLPGSMLALGLTANATLEPWAGTSFIVSYPILPWTAVMAAGFGLGGIVLKAPTRWPMSVTGLGLSLLALFFAARLGQWGLDPMLWSASGDTARDVLAFLNAQKYPPSPLFLAMTLGPVLLIAAGLAWLGDTRATRFLTPLGAAPLFFYILHLYALRIAGLAAAAVVWGVGLLGPPPLHSAPEWPLWAVWAIWAAAMPILFLPTAQFARYKRRRGGWTGYF